MAIFDRDIINVEGGLTNDPSDPGGLTKYGIDQRSYPTVDILNLTVDQAIDIYERDYWNKCSLSMILNQEIADIIFLFVVNVGVTKGVLMLQNSLNHCLTVPVVVVDGVCGERTINAINACNHLWLEDSLRLQECQYYLSLINKNPKLEIFFKGWITRVFDK